MSRHNRKSSKKRTAGERLAAFDNAVQSAIRENVLRVPEDGSKTVTGPMPGLRAGLAATVFRPNSAYEGKSAYKTQKKMSPTEDISTLIAARALQAGGLTAAGAALVGTIEAFGNLADRQEPGQLDMGNIVGATALGAGVAASPMIHNELRDPSYRFKTPGRGRAAAITAAGAGAMGLTAAGIQMLKQLEAQG